MDLRDLGWFRKDPRFSVEDAVDVSMDEDGSNLSWIIVDRVYTSMASLWFDMEYGFFPCYMDMTEMSPLKADSLISGQVKAEFEHTLQKVNNHQAPVKELADAYHAFMEIVDQFH